MTDLGKNPIPAEDYLEIEFRSVRLAGGLLSVVGGVLVLGWLWGGSPPPALLTLFLGSALLGIGVYLVAVARRNPRLLITDDSIIHSRLPLPWPQLPEVPFSNLASVQLSTDGRYLFIMFGAEGGEPRMSALPIAKSFDGNSFVESVMRKAVMGKAPTTARVGSRGGS